jgi:phage shock protein A
MRRTHRGRIVPKISTLPRQATEAAAYLDIYKLVIEKKRLQQELEGMDERRQQICDRLTQLEGQITNLEQAAHQARDVEPSRPLAPPQPQSFTEAPSSFDTLFLDY